MQLSRKNLERWVKDLLGKDIESNPAVREFIGKGADFIEASLKTLWSAKKLKLHTALYDNMLEFLNSLELVNQDLAASAATKFADASLDKLEALLLEAFD